MTQTRYGKNPERKFWIRQPTRSTALLRSPTKKANGIQQTLLFGKSALTDLLNMHRVDADPDQTIYSNIDSNPDPILN